MVEKDKEKGALIPGGKGHGKGKPDPAGKMVPLGYRQVPEKEKVNWVQSHFNTVAQKYDLANTLLSFGIHHLWKRTAVGLLGLRPGDRVIDVCGGTADLSLLAAEAVGASGQVVLYDINWAMMQAGRPKVNRSPLADRIRYVQGDAERMAFTDQCFEAAMVGFGIRNLTHMEAGFREIHRVLKPGGKIMCLEFSRPTSLWFRRLYDWYSFRIMPLIGQAITGSKRAYTYLPESIRMFPLQEELSTLLKEIGFSRVSYQNLTNGIAVVHLGQKREA